MFLVYWIAMVAVGAPATDWANDGLFGDGWHLLGIGSKAYNEVNDEYTASLQAVEAFLGIEIDPEADDFDPSAVTAQMNGFTASSNATATVDVEDEETLAINTMTAYYDALPEGADKLDNVVQMTFVDAVKYLTENGFDAPDPADYGAGPGWRPQSNAKYPPASKDLPRWAWSLRPPRRRPTPGTGPYDLPARTAGARQLPEVF